MQRKLIGLFNQLPNPNIFLLGTESNRVASFLSQTHYYPIDHCKLKWTLRVQSKRQDGFKHVFYAKQDKQIIEWHKDEMKSRLGKRKSWKKKEVNKNRKNGREEGMRREKEKLIGWSLCYSVRGMKDISSFLVLLFFLFVLALLILSSSPSVCVSADSQPPASCPVPVSLHCP